MAKTVIQAGSLTRAQRDRRFVCTACGAIFDAPYADYEISDDRDVDLLSVAAWSECPTCGRPAGSSLGSSGEVPEITGLVLHNRPDKTVYRPGEMFVPTGLAIATVWSNGAVVDAALSGFTFAPDETTALDTDDTEIVATHTASGETVSIPIAVRNEIIPLVEPDGENVFVYDGTAHEVEVIRYNGDVMTRADYTKTSAGSYTATYTPKTGYCWPDGTTEAVSIPWTIRKAVPTVTAPTPKTGLVYSGEAQALISAGTTTGGTMQYKLGSGSWGTSVPTATDAGTYTVKYRVNGGTNYEDVAEVSLPTITVAEA